MTNELVFEHVEEISSTNDELKSRIKEGLLASPFCLSAQRQTCGRGRRGRSWLNTDGALMMSIAYPVESTDSEKMSLIGVAAALGVHDALSEQLENCFIKWPNDMVCRSGGAIKKLCGILSEIVSTPSGELFIVIGIGVNANCDCLPCGLMQPATSIRLELGKRIDTETLKRRIAECVLRRLNEREDFPNRQLEEYSARCATLNSFVSAKDLDGNTVVEGIAKRVLPDGRLLVIDCDSREVILDSSDVSIRPH